MSKARCIIVDLYAVLFVCLVVISCSNSSGSKSDSTKETKEVAKEFPYQTIPTYIQTQEQATQYMVMNFWKSYFNTASKDTALYNLKADKLEDAYARYVAFLNMLEGMRWNNSEENVDKFYNIIDQSQKKLFSTADSIYMAGYPSLLMGLISLSEKYLYDPNSPYLNEETYIPALESILELKGIDSLKKMSYKWQLELARLNRIGQTSNNFEFVYKKGNSIKQSTLYSLKAKYLLVYFNNPDCSSCKGQRELLLSNPKVAEMLANGQMKVLSMYIDEQVELWEQHYSDVSQTPNWIYARDEKLILRDNELYGIRAIPSMYLLDADKKVILKDATAEMVSSYFQ